jgi:hypothetical protein
MRRELLVASMGEKTIESFADGIGNLVGFQLIVGFMFGIYLAPPIVAVVRGHHRWPWIGLLNFAAGWIAALVWLVTGIRPASDNACRQNCSQDRSASGGVKPRTRRVSAPLPLSRGLPPLCA